MFFILRIIRHVYYEIIETFYKYKCSNTNKWHPFLIFIQYKMYIQIGRFFLAGVAMIICILRICTVLPRYN
jgi:hypothetical protein